MKKHILVLNRSFWPDVESTGQLLTELCEELAKKYRVTVIVGRSYYVKDDSFRLGNLYNKKIFNGIEILQVRHTKFWKGYLIGRLINWLTYGVLSFFVALGTNPDIIIACTDPPFLGIIGMLLSRLKRATFIFNCKDLYPDIAVTLCKLKPGILKYTFDYLNKRALFGASGVVCLGQSMKNRLKSKGLPEERIKIIPDWADIQTIKPVSRNQNSFREKLGISDKFVIMYSGNIGFSQDFSPVLRSLSLVRGHFPFYLVFIGEGVNKEKLKKEARLLRFKNILFLPYQPKEKLAFSLSAADLHLVLLRKGMGGASVPSKIYGIMAAGRPYLALADSESEPSLLAKESECGLWAPPDNIEAIAKVFDWALNHQNDLEEMGKRARRLAETRFDKNIAINEWFKLLAKF